MRPLVGCRTTADGFALSPRRANACRTAGDPDALPPCSITNDRLAARLTTGARHNAQDEASGARRRTSRSVACRTPRIRAWASGALDWTAGMLRISRKNCSWWFRRLCA